MTDVGARGSTLTHAQPAVIRDTTTSPSGFGLRGP
jgi:hypothetical protein